MFAQIITYYNRAKWIKWISHAGLPIIGILLIVKGYMLIQDNSVHLTGTIFVISGTFWLLGGVIEWISSFLNQINRIVCTVIETLML